MRQAFYGWTPYKSLYNLVLHAPPVKEIGTRLHKVEIWCLSMEFQIFTFCVELGHLELVYNACSKHKDLNYGFAIGPSSAKSKVQFNPISRDPNRPRNLFALEILLGVLRYYVLAKNFGVQYCRNCPQICPSNWPLRPY